VSGNRNQNSRDSTVVRLRFRNLSTDNAVDVKFFVSPQALANLPDDLLVDANRLTENIGLAGSGLLAPGEVDAITLACGESLIVGTRGGDFRDAESGASAGQGPVRFAVQGAQFACGDTVVYSFDDSGGTFRVTQSIE